jgi:hypothetical protein
VRYLKTQFDLIAPHRNLAKDKDFFNVMHIVQHGVFVWFNDIWKISAKGKK